MIGGTGFVGRHAVDELIDHGYDVTSFGRGTHGYRFPDGLPVERIAGDRSDPDALTDAADLLAPDLVVDCAAFYPGDVRAATDAFADADACVYVSSGGVYAAHTNPKREDDTPLHDCTPEQTQDDSMASYGPRKADCDREVSTAADRRMNALSVRPTMVYGPKTLWSADRAAASAGGETRSWADDLPGLQTDHDYWIDRVGR